MGQGKVKWDATATGTAGGDTGVESPVDSRSRAARCAGLSRLRRPVRGCHFRREHDRGEERDQPRGVRRATSMFAIFSRAKSPCRRTRAGFIACSMGSAKARSERLSVPGMGLSHYRDGSLRQGTFTDAVANPANGFDIRSQRTEFFAQAAHMGIDRAGVDNAFVPQTSLSNHRGPCTRPRRSIRRASRRNSVAVNSTDRPFHENLVTSVIQNEIANDHLFHTDKLFLFRGAGND